MTTTAPPGAPAPTPPPGIRLRPGDLAALASIGLAARKLRAVLSALGIAIGVAAIVAVLGLAASSTAALLEEIQAIWAPTCSPSPTARPSPVSPPSCPTPRRP